MKTKFMMLLAAMLLSASAFAQSKNNEPLKGDVNGDGKVDVADINEIIKIMKEAGGSAEPTTEPTTTRYWYVGITKPDALPTDDSQLANGNSEGWRKIDVTSGTIYDAANNRIRFSGYEYYWLIIPTGIKVESSDGNNYLNLFESSGEWGPDTTTIPNYTIYTSRDAGGEFGGILKY